MPFAKMLLRTRPCTQRRVPVKVHQLLWICAHVVILYKPWRAVEIDVGDTLISSDKLGIERVRRGAVAIDPAEGDEVVFAILCRVCHGRGS